MHLTKDHFKDTADTKVLEDRTFVEKSPDGQKIQYHYTRKDIDGDKYTITVQSSDLMDTAEDMAEAMSAVPAKDIKSVDDTTKVLGESVFKSGVEDMEELEAEDPFLQQPIEDLEKDESGLSTAQTQLLEKAEKELRDADQEFEEEEEHDAATEAVLASRKETMKDIDSNADGVLEEGEISAEIGKDMQEADEVSMLQQMKDEKTGLDDIIQVFDKDGDKELTEKELFGGESAEKQKQYDDLFNAADQNQDGKLDEEELFDMHNFNWMKDADPEGYFTQKAKDHITYMDVNGDGKVDWSEFKYFMKPHVLTAIKEGHLEGDDPEEHLAKFEELFKEADVNHDGSLSVKEMRANLEDRQKWMEDAAAKEVTELADDNKDGKLSLNEVINNADKFGAKTEDFFEDQDLLTVDAGDENTPPADGTPEAEEFVKKSLRGGTR